jgi:hypothetical protein
MKTYGGVDVEIHIFLTSALNGGEWSATSPGRFTPGEIASSTHWIGGWVGPRIDLEDVERRKILPLPGLELRSFGRQAHGQSPYRLRYPSSPVMEGRPILIYFLFVVYLTMLNSCMNYIAWNNRMVRKD